MIKTFRDDVNRFFEVFNDETGFYMRSGIYTDTKLTDEDPFMRKFPGLLDIGIMGGCTLASAGLCKSGGDGSACYQGGRPWNPDNDMKYTDYCKIIDEGAEKGLQQVALGGAGNPNDHADFINILRYTREKGIVPNYTTAGYQMTEEMFEATKKYCGAVAVSWYGQDFTVDALNRFIKYGCKTNIHFVLSRNTIRKAINMLMTNRIAYDNKKFSLEGINAIIFLFHKPIGKGTYDNTLSPYNEEDEEDFKNFIKIVEHDNRSYKIGFDSCTIPGIINYSTKIDRNSIDTCEGGRFSAYISANMYMYPCSFDQKGFWKVNLKEEGMTIEKAWHSREFESFRNVLRFSCETCKDRKFCMGGCPINYNIPFCKREERDN